MAARTGRVKTSAMLVVFVTLALSAAVTGRCFKTPNGKPYSLTIGLLTETTTSNFTIQRTIQENIRLNHYLKTCFKSPHYVTLAVNTSLRIPSQGWTTIKNGIDDEMTKQGALEGEIPNVIIGPFYTNLAMILERLHIPYVVTDYKGFDWIDMSRVQDTTPWGTLVEMRPPAQEQNLAVVDFFISENSTSAVMIMPESAADNQECQNLASQMLGVGISLIPYTLEPHGQEAEKMVQEVLRNAQLFRQKRLIVCSPRDTRDRLIHLVLRQARLFDLTTSEDQVIVIVDPSSHLQPMASVTEMYRLGLFSARCRLLAFRYVEPSKEEAEADAGTATAKDAAAVITFALYNYLHRQSEQTDRFSPERFLEELRQVKLPRGPTGALEFNSTGQRINYTLHLYNHGGQDMYTKIAEWTPAGDSPATRLNLTDEEDEANKNLQYGIFPDLVKIVVVLEEPFVMLRDPAADSTERYEGFTIDLLRRLAEELKFKYEIYVSPRNAYGSRQRGDFWDGMVAEILAGNATLAAGAISITSGREEMIDFSLGVLRTGVNILVKKPTETLTIFQFMMPFSLELWMAIVGASTFVSLVFFLMDYTNHDDRRFTMKETIWFCVGTLLKRGTDFVPAPVSQRILTVGFTFFVLITVSTYTANMAAFLTTKNLGDSVDSFESLAADKGMSCGTVNNSATMAFLHQGTKRVFNTLWEKISSSQGLVPNATEGRRRVIQGGYAFIFDYLINSYSELRYCDTMSLAATILIQEHGIGMRAGAPFKTNINIVLLRLKEEGFIQELKKKWWDDRRTCDSLDDQSTRSEQMEFGLEHMAGVFIVGLLGLGVALALFLFKKLYFVARRQKEGSVDGDRSSNGVLEPKNREKEKLCQTNTSFV